VLKGPAADVLKDILVSICETYHYKRKLFYVADDLRIYGNHLTNIAQKRLYQLFRTKAYRVALAQYHNAKSMLSSLDKGTAKYNEVKKKTKNAADVLENLQGKYKLTFEDLRHDMAEISRGSKINSILHLIITVKKRLGIAQKNRGD